MFRIEKNQRGLSTAGKNADLKDKGQRPKLRLLSKWLYLCCHSPRVLDSAVLPYDMVDANFNIEKGSRVVLICKYLKHSSGAELIKLLIKLKTQTEERKKQ